jgi:hypothetical protein
MTEAPTLAGQLRTIATGPNAHQRMSGSDLATLEEAANALDGLQRFADAVMTQLLTPEIEEQALKMGVLERPSAPGVYQRASRWPDRYLATHELIRR